MALLSAVLLLMALVMTVLCVHRVATHVMMRFRKNNNPRQKAKESLSNLFMGAVRRWPFISKKIDDFSRRKRMAEMEAELPEVLRLLCSALESGSSLLMALRYAASNCREPLSSELKRTVWDIEAGQSFDEAIEGLRKRTDGAEFAYLSVAMEIQHTSGGSLTEILDAVSAMLKQSAELKEDLRTKTAQGRLSSRIVAIMPFALLAIFSVFSPGYLAGFFGSPAGILLFILALLLEAAGVVLVFRALRIDFCVDLEGGA